MGESTPPKDRWVLMSEERAKECSDGRLAHAFWTMQGWGRLAEALVYESGQEPAPPPADDSTVIRVPESIYNTSRLWRLCIKESSGDDAVALIWARNASIALKSVLEQHPGSRVTGTALLA